jgi:UDP-N-acetylmuramoylalanine--D-glutamate ligase
VVLLSPAAPSYGQYRNFEHRSEAFADAIKATA